jgi:hypothetical protein
MFPQYFRHETFVEKSVKKVALLLLFLYNFLLQILSVTTGGNSSAPSEAITSISSNAIHINFLHFKYFYC